MLELSAIYRYPLKSAAAERLRSASVEKRGLVGDRRWLLVDDTGQFLTGRKYPQLVRLSALENDAGELQLAHPDLGQIRVPRPGPNAPRMQVTVWSDSISAVQAEPAAAALLGRLLGRSAQLVYMDAAAIRAVDAAYARPGDEVSFADGFPLLLISQSALDQLNQRASHAVEMLRFRPNLVVNGSEPHAEDGWRRIRIGAVEFEVAKPCVRCVFTAVDSTTGSLDPDGEPLATLKQFRRGPKGITFGQNLIARGPGVVKQGDSIEVLEQLL